jgi:hypothetical protein
MERALAPRREEGRLRRPLLLRIAAVLSLVTCVGHTIGTFMPVPTEQTQMHATIATMKATLVPMPVGSARSYMEILDGNNICTSLFLALCAALLFALARAEKDGTADRVIALVAFALAGIAIISFRYFFPVPGVFTGLAAVLAWVARSRTPAASPA